MVWIDGSSGSNAFFLGAYVLFFPSFFTPSFFWSKSQIASSEDWVIFAYRNITLFYLHSWLIVWPEIDFWVENHFSLKIWRHCSAIVLCCWWEFWCRVDLGSFVDDLLFLFGFKVFSPKGSEMAWCCTWHGPFSFIVLGSLWDSKGLASLIPGKFSVLFLC